MARTTKPADLSPMPELAADVERNAPAAFIKRLASQESQRAMKTGLRQVVAILTGSPATWQQVLTFPWHKLEYHHALTVRATLMGRGAAATTNSRLAALRGVLGESWRLGWLPAEQYHRAVDIKNVTSATLLRGRALDQGEIAALMKACLQGGAGTEAGGVRDAAMVAVLFLCGLRRAELVALDLDHYSEGLNGPAIRVEGGKGNRSRTNPIGAGGQVAINAWLDKRGRAPGPLFCGVVRSGRVTGRRLTVQAVLYILRMRGALAGLQAFSPHDLRRTFASSLLDRGADAFLVQRLMGHQNPITTARYDRRGEEAKRAAVALLHLHYPAPGDGDQ